MSEETANLSLIINSSAAPISIGEIALRLQGIQGNQGSQGVGIESISDGATSGTWLVTMTDGTTYTVTAASSTYSVATETEDGLMSSVDKVKLDGVAMAAAVSAEETARAAADALEATTRGNAVTSLQSQIDAVNAAQNLVDIVGTKAALDAYSTANLQENDKIQVLADETNSGQAAIYSWNGAVWSFVGLLGTSYTKSEVDALLSANKSESDAADQTLQTAITANENAISSETTARDAEDETLQGQIETNASAITALQTKTSMLTSSGDGTKYLTDDGTYKVLSTTSALNKVSIYLSTYMTTNAGNIKIIPFDVILNDDNGLYNSTSHRIVIPSTGWYLLSAQVKITYTASVSVVIEKNGVKIVDNVGYTGALSTKTVYCTKGDYIEVYVYTSSTYTVDTGIQNTFFTLLGPF